VVGRAVAAYLLTWFVAGALSAAENGSPSGQPSPPELANPHQAYQLKLRPFIPIPSRPAGFLLEGRINGGAPLRLLLDSGAEFVVIGTKAARSAALSPGSDIELTGLGNRRARLTQAKMVEIGPISFRDCRVALVDGKVVEGADGVIPLSFFSEFLLRLDFPEKKLSLIPYPPEIRVDGALTKSRALLVPATLNGTQSGFVVLDTAAFSSAVSRKFAWDAGDSGRIPGIRIAAGTGSATGEVVSSAVRFQIAGQVLSPNDVVALDLSNLSRHYGMEVVGVLGFPALSAYILTIDYRNECVKMSVKRPAASQVESCGDRRASGAQLAFR